MSSRQTGSGVSGLLRLGLVLLLALTVSACGGGSSSGGGSSGGGSGGGGQDNNVVSGRVTDPAIEGAAVRLVDAQDRVLTRIQITDQTGRFSFGSVGAEDLTGARVVAVGGKDVKTGQDLSGITLEATRVAGGETLVTPLTTLTLAYEREGGTAAGLAGMLGLAESDLIADPAGSAEAQRVSLLVTELLVAMKGVEDSKTVLLDKLHMAGGDLEAVAQLLASETSLPGLVTDRLQTVQAKIEALDGLAEAPADAAGMVRELNRINVRTGIADYLANNLSLVPANDAEQENITNLADAIFDALNQRGLPADSAALLNIARYAVVINALSADDIAAADFTVPQPVDPEGLLPLLANTNVVNSELPLAVGEELGDDNAARVDYFFRSDQSPFYRATRLFDGVIDDQILDPIYRDVAAGQASGGLIEEARLTVESSVFQKTQKAQAYRQIGRAQQGQGDTEGAISSWLKALELYNQHLATTEDAAGVPALTADDGTFFTVLSTDFRNAGHPEHADAALRTIRNFIAAQEGQPYSTAYGRVGTAASRNATALVAEAVENGLTGSSYTDALSATEFFHDIIMGGGKQNLEDFCYAVKTIQLSGVGDLYLALGDFGRAETVRRQYESLFEVDCNKRAISVYANRFAALYGTLGYLDEFKTLIAGEVRAYDAANNTTYEQNALKAIAVYEAVELARQGSVAEAVEVVRASSSNLRNAVELLTYTGIGERDIGNRYLARLLWDAGSPDAALAVADAAFEIAASPEFAAAEVSPASYLGQGCRKVARLYEWFDQPGLAKTRMDTCTQLGVDRMADWGTVERAAGWQHIAGGYQFIGHYDRSLNYIDTWVALIPNVALARDRAYQYSVAALYRANAGAFDQSLQAMSKSVDENLAAAGPGDEQTELSNAIRAVLGASGVSGAVDGRHEVLIDTFRNSIPDGRFEGGAQAASEARALLRKVLVGETGKAGLLPLIAALNDPEARETYMQDLIYWLAFSRSFDEAIELADNAPTNLARYQRQSRVAQALVSYDDYPGSTTIRFDFDGDGLPDFFNPNTSLQERNALAVTLDDDIDGDGVPDSVDPTPYCGSCEI